MSESLYWWAHELFETGGTCKSMLVWEYDPYALGAANGSDLNFESYLRVKAQMIEERGYLHSDPRAAIGTLLSLTPHFRGAISGKFLNNIHRLIDRSYQYLSEWNEVVSFNPEVEYRISALIFAHMQRALLEDAINESLSPFSWKKKAKAFLEFGQIVDPDDVFIWKNEKTEIFLKQLRDNTGEDPHHFLQHKCAPDLLTHLTLGHFFEYADILLYLGYGLDELVRHFLCGECWHQIEDDKLLLEGIAGYSETVLTEQKRKVQNFAFQNLLDEKEINLLCDRFLQIEERSDFKSLMRNVLTCFEAGFHKEVIQAALHIPEQQENTRDSEYPGHGMV